MEKKQNKEVPIRELDRTGRFTAILLDAIKQEGIDDPKQICEETMNTANRIFCLIAEFWGISPKTLILDLLNQTIKQIEDKPEPKPKFMVRTDD